MSASSSGEVTDTRGGETEIIEDGKWAVEANIR